MKRLNLVVVITSAFACIGLIPSSPARAQSLVGNGEWQSHAGAAMKGTWEADLTRSGDDLSGTFTIKGSPLFGGGVAGGTINGDDVVLGFIVAGENQATFNGTLSGESISGEWELPAINDRGEWHGTLKAANGSPSVSP